MNKAPARDQNTIGPARALRALMAVALLCPFAAMADTQSFGPGSSMTPSAPRLEFTVTVADRTVGGDGTIQIFDPVGDFDEPDETFDIYIDDVLIATGLSGGARCEPVNSPLVTIPQATLAPLVADGVLEVSLRASAAVDAPCSFSGETEAGIFFEIARGEISFPPGQPEIAVSSSVAGAIADGGTDDHGVGDLNIQRSVTYTVTNEGSADLTIAQATSAAARNVTVDSIGAPSGTTVAANGSATFTVTYTPTAVGAYSFDLAFVNDDADENPYDITVTGSAVGLPEIDMSSSNSGAIADGGADSFGLSDLLVRQSVTYTVTNTGTDTLTLGTPMAAQARGVTVDSVSAPGLSTLTPGGSTTFAVQFTPNAVGGYSFDVSLSNNDEDENPYDLTVTGSVEGAPEIAVSGFGADIADGDATPSPLDATDFGTTGVNDGTVTQTYTIANTGSVDLSIGMASITGAAAGDFRLLSQPGSVVAPQGTTSFLVAFSPTAEGARDAEIVIPNSDADEAPFNFAITGAGLAPPEGPNDGAITIVQVVTGEDVTLNYASSESLLTFSLTSSGGTAQQSIPLIPQGTYTVTVSDPAVEGYALTGISCDDSDSTTDLTARSATVVLAAQETVTCTFSVNQNPTIIDEFLTQRNRLLLAHQPDRGRRLMRVGGGGGQAGGLSLSGAPGRLPLPVAMNLGISDASLSFDASLANIARSGKPPVGTERWDIWVEGQYAWFQDRNDRDGEFGVVHLGFDYLLTEDVLVGMTLQYDWMEQTYAVTGAGGAPATAFVEGAGFMTGPYITARLSDQIYFDARAVWGQSENRIRPIGTYEDEFDTTRWLISAALVGEYTDLDANGEGWTIWPAATFNYISERQDAYVDSLGATIPGQTLYQGDIRVGPRVGYTRKLGGGMVFNPWVEVNGVLGFGSEGDFATRGSNGASGSVRVGANLYANNGLSLTVSGQYDGVGARAHSYGGQVRLGLSF